MNRTTPRKTEIMDERQSQITQKAIVISYFFLILCLLIATIYRIATTGDAGWELFAIIGSALVTIIVRRLMGDIEVPLDYRNRPLPTGNSRKEKLARYKSYAIESFFFGLVFGIMDVLLFLFGKEELEDLKLTAAVFPQLSEEATVIITALLAFSTMFLVSFVFDSLIGELFKVRRYNKMIAELETEENDED